jgi:glutamate formiminotransferase
MTEPLLECVPNFAEGRRPEVLAALSAAVAGVERVRLLGAEMDPSHNRAVLTFAGPAGRVVDAALEVAAVAVGRIDLRGHSGAHPRLGALDVLPFIPLAGADMDDAVAAARLAGERIAKELLLPVFLYGFAATRPERRELSAIRNQQFEGVGARIGTDPVCAPDFGPAALHPSAGAVSVGARRFLIAFNVNLQSPDLTVARLIAARVREKNGGLPAVRALGFYLSHKNVAQVSMNLVDFERTSVRQAFDAVAQLAAEHGVAVLESELIGLVPRAALDEPTARHVRLRAFDPRTRVLENVLLR